jgi:hypothetical protein
MDLREIEWNVTDRIHLAQERDQWKTFVSTVMKFRVPYDVRKFLNS